nr:chaperone modulator CbpM [Methylocystis sp. WRRC1]
MQTIALDRVTLNAWVAEAWLAPNQSSGEPDYNEMDLARARLILELQKDMGVNDPGVGVILHLLDQLHGLRSAMKDLLETGLTERSIS